MQVILYLIAGWLGNQMTSLQEVKGQLCKQKRPSTQPQKMLREAKLWTWASVQFPRCWGNVWLNTWTVAKAKVDVINQILLQILVGTEFVQAEGSRKSLIKN